jgi:hypothetical protein
MTITLPRSIQLGEMPTVLRPLLAEDCIRMEEILYSGELAAPYGEQLQINCSGFNAFGAPREAEFMFNDGPLGHVWILVQAAELTELRQNLEKAFGSVVYETEAYAVFASGNVALRQSPPEILVAVPNLITEITGYIP